MGNSPKRILQAIKNFLFKFVNKKFLIFLSFFALSGVFWLIMTLNETMEKEIAIPVVLTHVPKNMVIMNDGNDTVRVTVRDKGYSLATYFYTDEIKPIVISLPSYIKSDEHAVVSTNELQKMVYQQLHGSSRIVSIKPDKLEYSFISHELQKTVPVRFAGNITPANSYDITQTIITPRNVTVYAPKNILDSLHYLSIRPFNKTNINDTIIQVIGLQHMRNVKTKPEQVTLKIYAERLTEKQIDVPIQTVNVPEGKILRIFPTRVNIKCVVRVSQYNNITEDNFKVVADYNSLMAEAGEKCTIRLETTPENVSKVSMEINEVDYLIEQ